MEQVILDLPSCRPGTTDWRRICKSVHQYTPYILHFSLFYEIFWQNIYFGPSIGQVHPSTFKKINLIPQILFLGQIYSYINIMIHNTMRLIWRVLFTLAISSPQFASWALLQKVDKTCACCSYMIYIKLNMKGHFNKYERQQSRWNISEPIMSYHW